MLTEYAHAGVARERAGNDLERAAPSGVYRTADGKWLAVSGNGDNVFRRLCRAMGREELAADPRFSDNQARVASRATLDAQIGVWLGARTAVEAQSTLDAAGVPAGPVMSVADIAADPQYRARDMITSVLDERLAEGHAVMPGIVPRLEAT